MTDDFHPGPEFRRAVDQRTRQLRRRRRWFVTAAGAAVALAAAIPLTLAGTSDRTTVRILAPPSTTTPTTLTAPPSTVAAPTTTVPAATDPTIPVTTTVQPAGTPTQVINYNPFLGGRVDPAEIVTARYNAANCYPYRTATTGRTYYRCFAQSPGGIFDPCFAGPQGTSGPLVCPADPITRDVVVLDVTPSTTFQPTDVQTGGAGRPWAFQLSGGAVCEFVAAAWGGLGPYDCQVYASGTVPADCRQPSPSQALWVADCQDQKTAASPFKPAAVSTAWF